MKEVLLPLSGLARVYALRHELDETHTLDRLEALAKRALVTEGDLQISLAYELLLRLRLPTRPNACGKASRSTTRSIGAGSIPRRPDQLEPSPRRIAAAQKTVSYDFLGGT